MKQPHKSFVQKVEERLETLGLLQQYHAASHGAQYALLSALTVRSDDRDPETKQWINAIGASQYPLDPELQKLFTQYEPTMVSLFDLNYSLESQKTILQTKDLQKYTQNQETKNLRFFVFEKSATTQRLQTLACFRGAIFQGINQYDNVVNQSQHLVPPFSIMSNNPTHLSSDHTPKPTLQKDCPVILALARYRYWKTHHQKGSFLRNWLESSVTVDGRKYQFDEIFLETPIFEYFFPMKGMIDVAIQFVTQHREKLLVGVEEANNAHTGQCVILQMLATAFMSDKISYERLCADQAKVSELCHEVLKILYEIIVKIAILEAQKNPNSRIPLVLTLLDGDVFYNSLEHAISIVRASGVANIDICVCSEYSKQKIDHITSAITMVANQRDGEEVYCLTLNELAFGNNLTDVITQQTEKEKMVREKAVAVAAQHSIAPSVLPEINNDYLAGNNHRVAGKNLVILCRDDGSILMRCDAESDERIHYLIFRMNGTVSSSNDHAINCYGISELSTWKDMFTKLGNLEALMFYKRIEYFNALQVALPEHPAFQTKVQSMQTKMASLLPAVTMQAQPIASSSAVTITGSSAFFGGVQGNVTVEVRKQLLDSLTAIVDPVNYSSNSVALTPVIYAYILGPVSGPGHFILSMHRVQEFLAAYRVAYPNKPKPSCYFLLDSRIGYGSNPETPEEIMSEKIPDMLRLMQTFKDRKDLGWDDYGDGKFFTALEEALALSTHARSPRFVVCTQKTPSLGKQAYHDALLDKLKNYMLISNHATNISNVHLCSSSKDVFALVISGAVGGYWNRMVVQDTSHLLLQQHFSPLTNKMPVCFVNAIGGIGYSSQILLLDAGFSRGELTLDNYTEVPTFVPQESSAISFDKATNIIFADPTRYSERFFGALWYAAYASHNDAQIHVFSGQHPYQTQVLNMIEKVSSFKDQQQLAQKDLLNKIIEKLRSIQWHDASTSLYDLINKSEFSAVFAEGVGTISDVMRRPNHWVMQLNCDDSLNRHQPIPGLCMAVMAQLREKKYHTEFSALQDFFKTITVLEWNSKNLTRLFEILDRISTGITLTTRYYEKYLHNITKTPACPRDSIICTVLSCGVTTLANRQNAQPNLKGTYTKQP